MRITSLAAGSGDAFVVEWGNPPRALLIDSGRKGCYQAVLKPFISGMVGKGLKRFELAIATHIDEDHMEGFIEWFEDGVSGPAPIADFWFNGKPHVAANKNQLLVASVRQAEALSEVLMRSAASWNLHFNRGPVVAESSGPFPAINLPGGMRVTVLGPGPDELSRLSDHWNEKVSEFGLIKEILTAAEKKEPAELPLDIPGWAGSWKRADVGASNLSSIVCLLECNDKAALFTGDADPTVVVSAWRRLGKERGKSTRLDFLKLNHHGSKRNCSPDLISALKPARVLISSDGSYYGHPEKEALATVVHYAPKVELIFNYDNKFSRPWLDCGQQKRWDFTARVGKSGLVDVAL